MRYVSLGSGSRGNATLVEEQGQCLLIDCGFNRKTALQRLAEVGIETQQLRAVLVTHEHGDHAKGVQALCEHLQIPFYTSFGTARKMQWLEHELWHCVRPEETLALLNLTVTPVVVPHDAQEPIQFVIQDAHGHKLGVLSDLGSLTPHVVEHYQQCHALQVEANHDVQMLRVGPYPRSLQQRVGGDYGHLNNQQCAELLQRVWWSGLRHVRAGHISEKNNDPALVQQVLASVLNCSADDVLLLQQDQVSDWYHVC